MNSFIEIPKWNIIFEDSSEKMEQELLKALNHRYATKRFNPHKKLSAQQVKTLVEAVRLTATSYGLQLMKLVVVEDSQLREKLREHSFDQSQVTDASHLFVLCRERKLSEKEFTTHVHNISEIRGVPVDSLERARTNWMKAILGKSQRDQEFWMDKQVYIALGNLLTACAIIGVDACPMEGFVPAEYDKILGLEEKNLASVLVVPVGFRSDEDRYATAKKVRRPAQQFLVRI
jgi:nitroreductase